MSQTVAPAPHITHEGRVDQVMLTVLAALIPGLLLQSYFFGWGVIINVVLATGICVLSEASVLRLRRYAVTDTLADLSAVVTGVLLGLSLPALAPWWLVATASVFAIVFAKLLYGGLGCNPFNPAMAGYVLVLVSFPLPMSSWLPVVGLAPHSLGPIDSLWVVLTGHSTTGLNIETLRQGIDGFTQATPLDALKTDLSAGYMISEALKRPIFDNFAGRGWEYINFAYLLGGLLLLRNRIIAWQIPLGLLGALTFLATFFYVFTPDGFTPPMLHLFSGATMLGAFFIATDPVTASSTPVGRLYFGIGIGVLMYVIRTWGGYPDAVAFAVLLMNMAAPTIDHFTTPRAYGVERSE